MQINREINYESVQAVKNYVRNGAGKKIYTFTNFFLKNNYVKTRNDFQYKGGNVFTHCPFHYDKTPSFSFSDSKGICNCFSCNFGGTYLDFILQYENVVNGRDISYYSLVNEILSNDPIMQAELGFSTIYTSHNIFKGEIVYKPFQPKNLKEKYVPSSYLELAKKLKKDKVPKERVFEFILLEQADVPVQEIYYNFYDHEGKVRETKSLLGNNTKNTTNTEKNKRICEMYDFTDLLQEVK